jgi:hypothetical protein
MTPEQTFGQLLGLGKSWRVLEVRFEAESSTFFLKDEETPKLFKRAPNSMVPNPTWTR